MSISPGQGSAGAQQITPSPLYPPGPPGSRPLRIALLAAVGELPPDFEPLFEALAGCEAVFIAFLVRCRFSSPGAKGRAFALYEGLDARLARRHLRDSRAPFDPTHYCPEARSLICDAVPSPDGTGHDLPPPITDRLREADLHVVLALDRSDWSGTILSAARHGLWHYSWNGRGAEHFDTAVLRALSSNEPLIRCELRRFGASGSGTSPIERRHAPIHPRSFGMARSRALAAAAALAPLALRRLRQGGQESVMPDTQASPGSEKTPGAVEILSLVARIAWRWIHFRRTYRQGEWWFLAMRRRDETAHSMRGFRALPAEEGRYYADPFLIEEGGRTHLFFEDFDQRLKRGRISHAVLAEDGMPSRAMPVLERPYHLSYPFVFRWRDETWLLPETGENRTVELYRCETFPQRWTRYRTLLQGWRMTDATLHEDESGRWWMFVFVHEQPAGGGALFLFMADTPLGPWRPHPGNPVQSDIRHARPGGRLFRREGRLLRPGQDGSRRYGGALWLMEVKELTPERYREVPLERLDPLDLPDNLCLHHRDATERFEFVDGMRLRPPEAAA